ncbi:PHD finger protein ALFIN 3 [Spatholobus suberectus]|nr:PHD finger protein ALFIN 3 [Spatholobus suberectus]
MEMASTPRTVEEIFKDYSARRTAIVRALSQDVDEFYGLCDPDVKIDLDWVCFSETHWVLDFDLGVRFDRQLTG